MSVAVIIVNYNSGSLLYECLNNLLKQTVLPQKIFVVDNASEDGSAAQAASLAGVELLQMTSNLGFAAGNNRALEKCDTEFVVLLNPDAFPESDWLEKLLITAQDNPMMAAFGSRQLVHENHKILDGVGDCYHFSGLVWRDRHGVAEEPNDLIPKDIFSPCAAAALYRRNILVSLGGFDEDYFCYVEDVDLGFRLRLEGYKAMYVPDAVVHHVGSATTGGQHSDFSIYHGHRNLVWTFVKNMPGLLFWLLLPMHLLLNIVSIGWFTYKGQGRVIFRAKRDALKGLPLMWRKRKVIQKSRRAGISQIWCALNKQIFPVSRR